MKNLYAEGADLNGIDALGRSAIHVVAYGKDNVEVAKFLIDNNINLDLLDN